MHIEFLVEEVSAETALHVLLPKMIGDEVSFEIHVYQGKQDLLDTLPFKLRGYVSWITDDYRIVVLVDRDDDECWTLKSKLEDYALQAGLPQPLRLVARLASCCRPGYLSNPRLN